jgi:hypothetical protein
MWLKFTTTICIVGSVVFLFLYPWIVGAKPPVHVERKAKVAYLTRSATYLGLESMFLIGSVVGSYVLARRMRAEYLDLSRKNMEALLEATLRDHNAKSGKPHVDSE